MTLEVTSPTEALLDGRYVLNDRVGQGGMATVYRAEDSHLGRVVAIKMIHPSEGPVESIERAHTEKALLASLSHPSLVTLYDAQLTPNRPQYLVMEFVDGPTLAARMAAGPLPTRDVARIVRDLAEGLTAVHAAGIVHRDIKPSNVLLAQSRTDRPLTAKLADFGIACSIDDHRLTTPGIVLGTLTYMAPEQLRDADPGTPVDIFALGLVALEALSGELGYPSLVGGRAAAVARLLHPPTIPDSVPEEWRDLLTRMTSLEPGERPAAADVARIARRLLRDYAANGATVAAPSASASAAVDDDRDAQRAPGAAGVAAAAVGPGAVGAVAGAAQASAGATPSTGPTAGTPSPEQTAVLPATDASAGVLRTRARRPVNTRARVLVGAAGFVAAGAVAASIAAFAAPPTSDPGRIATATVVRTASDPVETAVVDTPVETPVETVVDSQVPITETVTTDTPDESSGPGKGEKPEKAEKPDKADKPGNSGNSGKPDNAGKPDHAGKPDKADKKGKPGED